MAEAQDDLLDLIYGAAVDPSLWHPAMERFSDAIGGSSAWISRLSIVDGSGGSANDPMARIDPVWPNRYVRYFEQKNPLHSVADPDAYQRTWTPTILTDEDWIARDAFARTEFYNDFLRPQDLDSAVMIRLARFGVAFATLNVGRPSRRGRFSQADLETAQRYHPHLIRAFKLGNKLADLHALTGEMADVLDRSPHGLVLIDQSGAIRHANRTAEALMAERDVFRVANRRLGIVNGTVDRQLQRTVGQALSANPAERTGGTLSVPSPSRRLPLSVTVAPVESGRLAQFDGGRAALVCITDLEAGVSFPEQKLQILFGLTSAEARLARTLFEGMTLQDAAAKFGVSRHTLHVQLARIFEKTGTNGQTALVRLMMRAVGFNGLSLPSRS